MRVYVGALPPERRQDPSRGGTVTDQATEAEVVQPGKELVNATEAREYMAALYDPDMDFRRAALDAAYTAHGFRLVNKSELEGVPFIIKRIVYREGKPRAGMKGDYVSVECIVADREILSDPIVATHLPAIHPYGNEAVIFNDSGTGIRRQLTMMCEQHNLINVGKLVEGENPYDRQFQRWESGAEAAQEGFRADEDFGHRSIVRALRGLRVSEYVHPEYGEASTWYFG